MLFLFDHLIGRCQYLGWNGQAYGFRRLKIDDQFELSDLFDR